MTQLEIWKLERLRKEFGSLNSDEALSLALEAESFKNACGPADITWPKFARDQERLEEMALLLEKEESLRLAA